MSAGEMFEKLGNELNKNHSYENCIQYKKNSTIGLVHIYIFG